jgi:hypothetical protein
VSTRANAFCAAAALWLALAAPPSRHVLEASMSAQMLLQLPLLAAAGVLAARALPARAVAAIDGCNEQGLAGLVLLSFASACWMLPRALDASVTEPLHAATKFVCLPMLVGAPLALSWPRMGFVVRGVLALEALATCFRLGWLYLIWPERLCSLYLLDDQQRLGRALLLVGAALLLALVVRLMWGRFEPSPARAAAHAPVAPR